MNQKVSRQAIKKEQQENILAGIIDNESKTYTFKKTISIDGGKVMEGTFKAKYMGVSARLRIGTIRAKLLDGAPGQSLDALTDDIAYMIAYLTVALVETPKWWNYDLIDDIPDLRDIYMEVYNFHQSFRRANEQDTNVGNSTDTTSEENVEPV